MLMLVRAGSPIFFLKEQIRCPMSRRNFEAVVMDTVYTVIHVEYVFIAHILIYILHKYWMRNSISPFYDVTVYNVSFNSDCRILAAELNYRFTFYQ